MRIFPRNNRSYTRFFKGVNWTALLAFLATILLPQWELTAQEYRRFEDSRGKLEGYTDRATRMDDENSWTNYMELGIASERAQWEQEAFDKLQNRISEIEESDLEEADKEREIERAQSELGAASSAWNEAAEEFKQTERGQFRAENAELNVEEVDEGLYQELIARAEAAVSAQASIDLDGWEAAIQAEHAHIVQGFEDELAGELDRARVENAGLSGAELAAFESELSQIEGQIRREFETRDRFFVTRARNRYVALKRGDDLNARLATEESSATSVTENVIENTISRLETETSDMLQVALDETENLMESPDTPDFEAAGTNWEARMEAVITAGLRSWEQAEEDLYARRLSWQQEQKRSREEAQKVWEASHEEIKRARDEWLSEIQIQIKEGREQWQSKIAEFRENRAQAEQEMAEYIAAERERWDASSKELAAIVDGGGGALLETKDAFRYYDDLLNAMPAGGGGSERDRAIHKFYSDQRDYMRGAVQRFQGILASAEGVLHGQMHSGADHTGLLNDVRVFAGDLPERLRALDTADYETSLRDEMNSRSEDFVLYRRDMEDLIDRNAVFSDRAADLESSDEFDYQATADLEELTELVGKLERKYDEHKAEIAAIVNEPREGLDEAARLAAIKTDLDAWMALATSKNERLKKETVAYFNAGLGGYYLTGNEGDPYLMTRAEYEWELLRRERNYLTKKLRRAEAVKDYADRAFQHDAGLEMAVVTAERSKVALVHRDLREVAYQLLRGEIELDPLVYKVSPGGAAMVTTELDRILSERGIDRTELAEREATLNTELAILDDLRSFAPADRGDAADLIDRIDTYLGAEVGDSEKWGEHQLGIVREKLLAFRDRMDAGASTEEQEKSWTAIAGGAGVLREEIQNLKNDYDFTGLNEQVADIRALIARPNLTMIRGDLAQIKEQIQANEDLLSQAAEKLELAKDAYRQARIDYDVMRANNSEDLIRIDITNTTGALGRVIHQMTKLENVPGFDAVYDPLTAGRIEYLNEISEREQAQADLSGSSDALVMVRSVEASKGRLSRLDDLLGAAPDLDTKSAEDLADLFIDKADDLVNAGGSDPVLQSGATAIQTLESLKQIRAALDSSRQALDDARSEGDAAKIELARFTLAGMESATRRTVEKLVAAIRAEEKQRRDALFYYLDSRDGGGDSIVDMDALVERTRADDQALNERVYELSEQAATRIAEFVRDNLKDAGGQPRTFAALLGQVNDAIDGLPSQVRLADGYGYDDATALKLAERVELEMLRAWLAENRAAIEAAGRAPDASDSRSIADKVRALQEEAERLADDSRIYAEFQADIPTDVNDSWVVNYRADRESLLAELEGVLASSDSALAASFAALPDDRRALIEQYGATSSLYLRQSLQRAAGQLRRDLSDLESGFAAIYQREMRAGYMRRIQEIQLELGPLQQEMSAALVEKGSHAVEKARLAALLAAETDPAEQSRLSSYIMDLDARILQLDGTIAAHRPRVDTLTAELRDQSVRAQEASQPGSSSKLAGKIMGSLALEGQSVAALEQAARGLEPQARQRALEEQQLSAGDQVKVALGFYQTDANGVILRDGSDQPLVSREFIDLGVTDPAADLGQVLSGDQSGANLMRWAERLSEFARDDTKRAGVPAEVLAAMDMLEDGIREVLAAQAFIDHRYETKGNLVTSADERRRTAQEGLKKLGLVLDLQQKLEEAIQQAAAQGQDPARAALALLEDPANARLLRVYAGYDENGEPDGAVDPVSQERQDELIRLAERLRESQRNAHLIEVRAAYDQMLGDWVAFARAEPLALAPDRETFLEARDELKLEPVHTALNDIAGDGDFRGALWEWTENAPGSARLFRGRVIEVLTRSVSEGQALKDEVLQAIGDFDAAIQSDLSQAFAESERKASRDANLEVRTSVTNLMAVYARRGTLTRDTLLPEIEALGDLDDFDTSKAAVRAKMDELAGLENGEAGPATLELRRAMLEIIGEAGDTVQLKSNLRVYLNGLDDPAAGEVDQISSELATRSLLESAAALNSSPGYDPAAYPEELRDYLLVSAYQSAAERTEAQKRARTAGLAGEAQAGRFDLTGTNGELANYFLLKDFAEYRAANDPVAAVAAADPARGLSIQSYLAAYMADRSSAPELLPGGGGAVLEQLAHAEYARLEADIAANGIAAVDESAYFADFRAVILLRKAREYIDRNGITLSGATGSDRADELAGHLENFLSDPAFSVGGKTVAQRVLLRAERDRLFGDLYGLLEYNPGINSYLPPALDLVQDSGKLGDAPISAADFLPSELEAVADYATIDPRGLLSGVQDATLLAVGREAVLDAAMTDPDFVLRRMDDAELAGLAARAGFGAGTPAAIQTELVHFLRDHNTAVLTGGAGGAMDGVFELRKRNIMLSMLPDETRREALMSFIDGESSRLQRIEAKFLSLADGRHADLQRATKEERGNLLRAVIERAGGGAAPTYDALNANMRAEVDALKDDLYGSGQQALSSEERAALQNNRENYVDAFELQSRTAVLGSGLFNELEQLALAALKRGNDQLARAANTNRPALLRAFVELFYFNAGQSAALTPETQAFLDAVPGMQQVLARTATELPAGLEKNLDDDRFLVERFLDEYLETNEERAEIEAIYRDPAVLRPEANLALGFETAREEALVRNENLELAGALTRTIQSHREYFDGLSLEYDREIAVATELQKFSAMMRTGDDFAESRYSSFRTFVGTETKYRDGSDASEAEKQGAVLYTTSLGQNDPEGLLNSDNWADVLKSDNAGHVRETTNDDGDPVRLRSVYSVSDPGARNKGSDYEAEMRHTFFEHVANNYLDKISKLNGALRSVFVGANFADKRIADSTGDVKQELRDRYDPDADDNDLKFLEDRKIDAQSRLAIHSQERVRELQGKITGLSGAYDSAASEFAQAARRDQIASMPLEDFINRIFLGDANNPGLERELREAEGRHTALSNESERLRGILDGKNRELATALSDMAERWRNYEGANDEYEERAQVEEYAETPYLFASEQDSEGDEKGELIEEYRGDALQEFELARRAVDYIENQLQEAAYEVYIQDDLAEFNEIVTGLEAGQSYDSLSDDETKRLLELRDRKYRDYETLTAEEEAELVALDRREMYSRYKDVIQTRAEHIKHSMRMVRVHKANELIRDEVMRRRAVADEKEKQFKQTLSTEFGSWEGDDAVTEARNGVYARLAGMVEGGASNIFNEFRNWYWGGNNWAEDAFGSYVGASQAALKIVQAPKFWPTQIIEGAVGLAGAAMTNARDRNAIGLWMGAGGSIAEFGMFKGVYFGAVQAMGVRDQMKLKYEITWAIWSPLQYHWATATTARSKIRVATLEKDVAQQNMWLLYGLAASTASTNSIRRVMSTQREYEDALAALYYFTRIPDQQTLKERMIGYGAAQQDDPNDNSGAALYKLTEEDLVYLFDRDDNGDARYLNSSGGENNPSDEVKNESLDITGLRDQVEYRDAFGRRYDPRTIQDGSPGNLQGGYYWNGDERWTRLRFFRHDGSTYFRYAKVIADDADLHEVYNMEDVLKAAVPHGQSIRDDRFKKYNEAGNAVARQLQDQTFILNERDQTYENLFNQAAGHVEGGREFTGYRMTYDDYRKNADAVFGNELTQREQVQLKEWELREKELIDRYNDWEARVQTILDRGAKSWAGSEDRFLQRWREWEREFDRSVAEGEKKWDEEVAAHFTKKKNWEDETRARASEATIEKVLGDQIDNLNRQLRASSSRLSEKMETVNRTAMIQDAIQQMRREMPKGGAKLKAINKNIKNFSAKLSTAELVKGNFQNEVNGLANGFRKEMKEHQHRMKVLANVKIFEQYRQMIEQFKKQIEVQNRQIANQTAAAAMAQGYIKMGDVFVKKGLSSSAYGFVNAYKWFDVERAMDEKLKSFGFTPMGGGELVEFLNGKSNVEVEAYFYTQKLAVSAAIEEIQGRGSEAERRGSRDASVIGEFSAWVGSAGEDQFHGHADTLAGGSFGGPSAERSLAMDMMQSGFGELGSMGTRPGGAPAGFYVQLKHMGNWVAQQDAQGVAKAGEVDPITNTLNGFNPIVAIAQSIENVEVGSRVYGRDRGKLIGAQVLNVGKQALIAGGQIVMTAGNFIAPGVAVAVGAAMIAAGNAIQVNPTTGESSFKMTDQAAISTVTSIAGGLVPGLGPVAQAAIQATISVANAGMEYDEKGQSQGWKMDSKKLREKGVGMAVGAIGAGLGAELGGAMGGGMAATAIGNAVGSSLANNLYQHSQGNRQLMTDAGTIAANLGGIATSYMSLRGKHKKDLATNPKAEFKSLGNSWGGGERFLAGAVGHVAGAISPFSKLGLAAYEKISGEKNILARPPSQEAEDAKKKNQGNQSRRMTEILQGYATARENRSLFSRLVVHGGGALGFDADRLGNWMDDKGWESTGDLASKQHEKEAGAAFAKFQAFAKGTKPGMGNGREYINQLREHAKNLARFGMDTSKLEAQAKNMEVRMAQIAAAQAKEARARRAAEAARRRAAQQQQTQTAVPAQSGNGDWRIIRDWGINTVVAGADDYLGTNASGYLRDKYNKSKWVQDVDVSATQTFNDVSAKADQLLAQANSALNDVKQQLTQMQESMRDFGNRAANTVNNAVNTVTNTVTNAANQAWNTGKNAYNYVSTKMTQAADTANRTAAQALASNPVTRWAGDGLYSITPEFMRGGLDEHYRDIRRDQEYEKWIEGDDIQSQLRQLGDMRDGPFFDADETRDLTDFTITAHGGKIIRGHELGLETDAWYFPGNKDGEFYGKTQVYNHGLRSEGGNRDANHIIGDYYDKLDIEERRRMGYGVFFPNSDGRANNEVSSASVSLQMGKLMQMDPGQRFDVQTHSRGAHDWLGILSNAVTDPGYSKNLNKYGLGTPEKIATVAQTNREISAATDHVYMTSPALMGERTGAVSDLNILRGLAGAKDFFGGKTGDDRNLSPGARSLQNERQRELFQIYQQGRGTTFTQNVTMVGGVWGGFGGGGSFMDQVETEIASKFYLASPSSYYFTADPSKWVASPIPIAQTVNDGAVADGQFNVGAVQSFTSGRATLGGGQVRDGGRYMLNHGGTRNHPSMQNEIFRDQIDRDRCRVF